MIYIVFFLIKPLCLVDGVESTRKSIPILFKIEMFHPVTQKISQTNFVLISSDLRGQMESNCGSTGPLLAKQCDCFSSLYFATCTYLCITDVASGQK